MANILFDIMEMKLYTDNRLYNAPRFVYSDKDPNMQIPQNVLKCVVFIGIPKQNGAEHDIIGTGFFIYRQSRIQGRTFGYLVTAKHVWSGAHSMGVEFLSLRVNLKRGGTAWVDVPVNGWLMHPEDSTCDVAILSMQIDDNWDHWYYPIFSSVVEGGYIEKFNIAEGEEVSSIGLFYSHLATSKNIPIVRTGHIAAMESDEISTQLGKMRGYLIDSHTTRGMSGSPVFINVPMTKYVNEEPKLFPKQVHLLLGVLHGHFIDRKQIANDISVELNEGLSIVASGSRIIELLKFIEPSESEREDTIMKDFTATSFS